MLIRQFIMLAVVFATAGCLQNLSEHKLPRGADVGVNNRADVSDCISNTDEEFCAERSANCGAVSSADNCDRQRVVDCGDCIDPESCGGGTLENVCSCKSLTDTQFCGVAGANCGAINGTDPCGAPRTVDCGVCDDGSACAANRCLCTPATEDESCTLAGFECGELQVSDDGCGAARTIDCGSCDSAEMCGAQTAGQCGCAPETAAEACGRVGFNCGMADIEDNCGVMRTLDCGDVGCAAFGGSNGATCGGGGTPNVCACPDQTNEEFCAANGADCGPVTAMDSCGNDRAVNCGGCAAYETCSGGGIPNQCGCTPENGAGFCARLGYDCDNPQDVDNCGMTRTVSCGSCQGNDECGVFSPFVCDCVPNEAVTFCSDNQAECGSLAAPDRCGDDRNEDCGTCPAGEGCVGNQCECLAESDAQFCARLNACGQTSDNDNCGAPRSVDCQQCQVGFCDSNGTCNTCVPQSDQAFCNALGLNCGTVSGDDNCSEPRTANCGACADPFTCVGHRCECIGETDEELCVIARVDCGSAVVEDRCGDSRTVACGGCSSVDLVCVQNKCVCRPDTVPEFCFFVMSQCGFTEGDDSCGRPRSEFCGDCPLNMTCTNNSCVSVTDPPNL